MSQPPGRPKLLHAVFFQKGCVLVRFHLVVALLLAVAGAAATRRLLVLEHRWLHWLSAWLISINLITFVYYGYDKRQARRGERRIPEIVLFALALLGASPGAFLAMYAFRHKTIKGPFRLLFWCIVVVQALLIVWLAKIHWWPE